MKRTTFFHLFLAFVVLAGFLVPANARAAVGDLYVTDSGSGTILKFTPAGVKNTFASGLDRPSGLAFDRMGDLFVVEAGSGNVLKFTRVGVKSVFASGIEGPFALAFDGAGNLFVATLCGGGDICDSILRFTPSGTKTTFASAQQPFSALAFDESGNLLAAEAGSFENGTIYKFAPDGAETTFGMGPRGLRDIAFGPGGLFVATSSQIAKVSPTGYSVFTSQVNGAFGMAFDAAGNLFVADSGSGNIFKFTQNATRSTFASPGITGPAYLAFEPVVEKLRNISARGLVGTGENVLIGGFLAGGNALANNAVIIRAIGPSLSRDGITNPLSDPMLELHNASGAVIATNDNWQDTQATQIRPSHLAPTDPHEAAIYTTLPAGAYTAIVRGVSSATGVAVVEIYSLGQ